MTMRLPFLVAAFIAFAFATTSDCFAQKTLAWRFKKDAVMNLLIEQDTSMKLEVEGGVSPVTNQLQTIQNTNITWTVRELTSDGVASIEQLINRVQLDFRSSAGKFLIDTRDNTPLTGLAESMAKGIRPLAGSRFTVTVKPSGEISDVAIPEQLSQQLNELSTAGLKEIAANATLKFPTKPIGVGENWMSEFELDMQPFGKLIVSTTYQYLGEEQLAGRIFDRIKASTAVKVADPSNNGLKLKNQESSGMIWFDNTRGSIDHSEFKQEMSMNVSNPTADPNTAKQDMKQVIKQSMKLKYTPQL
jgi:hypothetical protein